MAVTEQVPAQAYTASGATAVFGYSFQVLDADDLKVMVDGVEVTFSATGIGDPSGGYVTLTATPTGGARVLVYRDSVLARLIDYQTAGDFLAAVVNADFDRLWLAIQELADGYGASPRSLRVPIGETVADLPAAASRADKLLGCNSSGEFVFTAPADGSAAALALQLADDTDGNNGAGLIGFDAGLSYPAGTVGAVLAAIGDGGVVVHDTLADLRAATDSASVAITRGYWADGDGGGGLYFLQSGASPGDNNGTIIERDDTAWYRLHVVGEDIPAKQLGVYLPAARVEEEDAGNPGHLIIWTGAKTDGTGLEPAVLPSGYSTSTWLMAADAMARGLGKALVIDGIAHCDLQVTVAAPTTWKFAGRTGVGTANTDLNMPQSYLYQSNRGMVGSVLLIVSHPGVRFFGGGILGPVYYDATDLWYYPDGSARDGIFIGSNSFAWYNGPVIARMGRDAYRIGDYTGGAGTNANGVYLQAPVACFNGRHAFNISDDSGSIDANTFLIEGPKAQWNGETAFLFGKTVLGGTIIAPKVETNMRGWFFDADTADVVIVGGNTEACTEPLGWQYRPELGPPWDDVSGGVNNVEEAPQAVGRNFFINHTVQGVVRHDLANGAKVERNFNSRSAIDITNTDSGSGADTMLRLTTTAGIAGMWKRSAAAGGELLIGTEGAYQIGLMLNSIIRWGFNPDGSLAIGGFSAVGTAGQVLTSGGPGAAVSWGAGGGTTSPLTTKGDLYTYSSTNARLPVGTNTYVLSADSSEPTGLKWVAAGTPTIVNPLEVAQDHAGVTKVVVENLSTSTGASSQVHLITDQGTGGMWQRATVDGGEFLFGTIDHAGDVGLMVNGTIRWGFLPTGALSIGGFSGAGTAGQVLTSAGAGAAAAWANASPLTTKGDLYTFSTANARLAKGTDGYVLTADSAEATGLKWAEVTGTGTVTSAAMTVPTGLSVSGSPITAAGTFAVTWAPGYRAYTDAENTKLAGLPTTAVSKTGDTMSGDLTVSKADATFTANATSGNANLVAQMGTAIGGLRASSTAIELGGLSAHEVRILGASGAQRILLKTDGYVYLVGLPTSSPGGTGRLWKDGSGYLRIT